MSRIGKQPVSVPSGIEVSIEADVLKVKGPKGELTVPFEAEYVSFAQEEAGFLNTISSFLIIH